MLFIWGARTLLHVIGSGRFRCPSCDSDRRYDLVEQRRWFTFFWIPIFPFRTDEQIVRCGACSSLWDTAVLQIPTTEKMRESLATAARAVVATTVARLSEHAVPLGIAYASKRISQYSNSSYEPAAFITDLDSFAGVDVTDYLHPVEDMLTIQGKEGLLLIAMESMSIFRLLSEQNAEDYEAALANVTASAAALGITVNHFRGIAQEAAANMERLLMSEEGAA